MKIRIVNKYNERKYSEMAISLGKSAIETSGAEVNISEIDVEKIALSRGKRFVKGISKTIKEIIDEELNQLMSETDIFNEIS
tara:strand:+ start:221 stop:466 length:246 start_codon:yes stop_codon:yes gene_type:complete